VKSTRIGLPRGSFSGLARQYWHYGRGRARVLRKHPDFVQPRHLVPAALVASLALSGAAATVVAAAVPLAAGLAGAYGAVLLAAGAHAARRAPARDAALVPAAIACMHVAYGAGVLAGLVGRRR